MSVVGWVAILAGAIALGAGVVRYLVVPPLEMGLYLLVCAGLVIGLAVLVVVAVHGRRRLLAVPVIFLGFGAGYLGATAAFLGTEERRDLPALAVPEPAQRDHAAVVYFTHGEPPAYSATPWLETFRELDADAVSFIPAPFRPFFFLAFREEYLKLGGSPHNFIHQDMAGSLEERYRAEGDTTTRFYTAFLDSNPRPDEAVIRALNDGASRVDIATVFVTVSSHTKAGQDQVAELDLDRYGVPICFSEPLWNSTTLQEMFVARADANLGGTPKEKVGVLLVGHGQPADWDAKYGTQTEQEIRFREAITDRLVTDGYRRENVSLAWMEFKEPAIDEAVRSLTDRGIERLLVFATSISASSLHSLYDIPEAVTAAGIPAGVEVVNLGAWDDDPLVIRAIKERVDACRAQAP
ncbi:MAG TPA: ferrochelatase [Candidatus Limnocylindrales bacterium]|nr:ferrochelatase [Candidatus Limnocylindrales bacterium]